MNDLINTDGINYDDIPELTKEDFARGKKNPFAGKFKAGYTIIIDHADYEEVITVTKKRRTKKASTDNLSYVAESDLKYGKTDK